MEKLTTHFLFITKLRSLLLYEIMREKELIDEKQIRDIPKNRVYQRKDEAYDLPFRSDDESLHTNNNYNLRADSSQTDRSNLGMLTNGRAGEALIKNRKSKKTVKDEFDEEIPQQEPKNLGVKLDDNYFYKEVYQSLKQQLFQYSEKFNFLDLLVTPNVIQTYFRLIENVVAQLQRRTLLIFIAWVLIQILLLALNFSLLSSKKNSFNLLLVILILQITAFLNQPITFLITQSKREIP